MSKSFVCFHKPNETNGYLSNWYPSAFFECGIRFTSVEQYFMYQKALRFNDEKIAKKILETSDVKEIKDLGRAIKGYDDKIWNGFRQKVMYDGLYLKFDQNETYREKLLNTGDAILVECAKTDLVWGIGWGMNDPERLEMDKWRGQGLLGFTLMMVREDLS